MRYLVTALFLLLLTVGFISSALAQSGDDEENPIPKVHVVQSGETLTGIAELYGTDVETLQLVNNIVDPALLYAGQELIIPGVAGDLTATVYTVQVGDTLAGIAAAFNTTPLAIAQQNGIIHPDLLYGGQRLAVTSRTGSINPQPVTGTAHVVQPGETLSLLALRYGVTGADLAAANGLPYPAVLFPRQRLLIPGSEAYHYLNDSWVTVRVNPGLTVQGKTISVYVENLLDGVPSGRLAGQPLHFAPYEAGYLAIVGIDVLTPVGLHTLELEGSGRQPWRPFQQQLLIENGGYGSRSLTIPAELNSLLDLDLRQQEDAYLTTFFTQFTATPQWEGLFQMPLTNTVITSDFGENRSYNGGPGILHTGADFFAPVGAPILAAANGTVIFNEPTQLRGNVIILDHGLGVMTAYYHLNHSFVTVGTPVTAGQTIGEVGETGLVTGSHLHWDLRIMDVPVNGQQWVETPFP